MRFSTLLSSSWKVWNFLLVFTFCLFFSSSWSSFNVWLLAIELPWAGYSWKGGYYLSCLFLPKKFRLAKQLIFVMRCSEAKMMMLQAKQAKKHTLSQPASLQRGKRRAQTTREEIMPKKYIWIFSFFASLAFSAKQLAVSLLPLAAASDIMICVLLRPFFSLFIVNPQPALFPFSFFHTNASLFCDSPRYIFYP